MHTTTAPSPKGDITLVTLTNSCGASVTLSSLGAGIISINVPDRDGHLDNVVFGYSDPALYLYDGPCAGKIPGRFANRIAKGRFTLDGVTYTLETNNGPNALHGGSEGFQQQIWRITRIDNRAVTFALNSPDGDAGYPGELDVEATYEWSDDCRLSLTIKASTSVPTVINLTNHTYWNLNGDGTGTALDHTLRIPATHYLVTDDTLVPTGEIAPVSGTPMDFTAMRPVGLRINDDFPALRRGKGYDACWVIGKNSDADPDALSLAAVLHSPASGRTLTVTTDQPGVQVYTGNWLDGSHPARNGHPHHDYDAIAIECQGFPDAPNHPEFPSARLDPGRNYIRHIDFHLTVDK